MENKRIFIALGVLVSLGGGYWYVNREKPEERAETVSNPWQTIARDQITRFSIDPAGDAPAIELEKRDNKWFMNAPGRGPADESQVTSMLGSFADMHAVSVASTEPGSHTAMEVDPEHATHVQVFRGSTKVFDGWVGKDLDGGTAVRFEGNARVIRVAGLERFRLQNAPREWRNRQITNIERAHVQWVQWQDGATTVRFDRNAETWTSASTNAPIERLDTARVGQLVTNLIALNATDFAAANATTGISETAPRFTIHPDNGPEVVLTLGSNSGDDGAFVKRNDGDTVFIAGRTTASSIRWDLSAVQTPLPPEGGVRTDATAPRTQEVAPAGAGIPTMGGMPSTTPGGQQIPPEIMRQIQEQMARQGAGGPPGGGH
jgi:hypothetical protein